MNTIRSRSRVYFLSLLVRQSFSVRDFLTPRGALGNIGRHFSCHSLQRQAVLVETTVSRSQRQHQISHNTQNTHDKNYLVQNVSGAEPDKPWG